MGICIMNIHRRIRSWAIYLYGVAIILVANYLDVYVWGKVNDNNTEVKHNV